MSNDLSQFYQTFFDEAAEHLAAMESVLLGLDVERPDPDALNAIFRAAHSIKGGAATFGFAEIAAFTHALESLLDQVRKGQLALRPHMIEMFLQSVDVISGQIEAAQGRGDVDDSAADSLAAALLKAAENGDGDASAPPSDAAESVSRKLSVSFKPVRGAGDGERAANVLSATGEASVLQAGDADGVWRLELNTSASIDEVRETLAFVATPNSICVDVCDEDRGYGFFDAPAKAAPPEADPGYGFFDETPQASTVADKDEGFGLFSDAPGAPETAASVPPPSSMGRRESDKPSDAPVTAGRRATDKQVAPASDATSIRVSVEKVDQLLNLVGELVITQAMLAQAGVYADPVTQEKLVGGLAQLERNTRDLQESVMAIRMMPISTVFNRFPRVVRDLATKLGKKIDLKMVGESTEIDKGMIEKITDPLNHLVRNSLDHGVETPEQRVALGKPEAGQVTLKAFQQGGSIVVEVADDGRGLDRERILAKARERGIAVSDGMADEEVWQLIFEPGFSTAKEVTDVSGRGVGMDVVKRNIQAIGGRIEIESVAGAGARMSIHLPLTLAILDGMSVSSGGNLYIIPLACVVESFQAQAKDLGTVARQGRVVHVRGEYVPVKPLREALGMPQAASSESGVLVILEAEGAKVALQVDELVGQHQVVIKSLEANFRRVPNIAAATIMGDGRVALILDVAALTRGNRQGLREAA